MYAYVEISSMTAGRVDTQASLSPGTVKIQISGWGEEMCPDQIFSCNWPMLTQVYIN